MRTLCKLSVVGVVVTLGLTGCLRLGTFNPFLGGTGDGDQATETDLVDEINTGEASSDPEGSPFNFNAVESGSIDADTDQTIVLSFENAVIDTDAGIVPGLTIRTLLAGVPGTDPYERDAELPYSAVVYTDGTGSQVHLTINATGVTITPLEITMDSATVTGANGAALFNEDQDNTPQEAEEDMAFAYVDVTGTTAANGVERDPRDLVVFTPPDTLGWMSDFNVTGINTISGQFALDTAFTTPSLESMFEVWSFDPATLTWTEVDSTPAYNGAGTLTLVDGSIIDGGQIYQVRWDSYLVRTAVPVGGFVQKGTIYQNGTGRNHTTDILVEDTIASVGSVDSLSVSDTSANPIYADVTISGGFEPLNLDTVDSDSVRFYFDEDEDGTLVGVPYSHMLVENDSPGNRTLRFFFGPSFRPTTSDALTVHVYPTVRTTDSTPVHVLDPSEPNLGVSVLTDSW